MDKEKVKPKRPKKDERAEACETGKVANKVADKVADKVPDKVADKVPDKGTEQEQDSKVEVKNEVEEEPLAKKPRGSNWSREEPPVGSSSRAVGEIWWDGNKALLKTSNGVETSTPPFIDGDLVKVVFTGGKDDIYWTVPRTTSASSRRVAAFLE